MGRDLGKLQSAGQLVASAVLLSAGMAIVLATGNGLLAALAAGKAPWTALLLSLAMVVASTGAILAAFNVTLRPGLTRLAAAGAGGALALLCGVEATHAMQRLPLGLYFAVSLFGEILLTFAFATVLVSLLRVSGRWTSHPPVYAAGAVALFGVLGFIGQSFIALETVTHGLSVLRDVALLATPALILLATGLVRTLRLDPKSALESMRLRIPGRDMGVQRHALTLAVSGLALDAALDPVLWFFGVDPAAGLPVLAASVFSFGWLGILSLSYAEIAAFSAEQKHGNVSAKLAPNSARRFLRRHLTEKQAWAATVGLRTTSFNIDHDPGGVMHGELPASIMQIRSEEIQRCVSEVLGAMFLHSHVVGHRMSGALDPETSIRPCVDALKMFACLYLDAGPLVERRIKGLAALLPIVDPGLARILKPKDVDSIIRRNLWFFHFDFGWIDQHVIHTPRATRYDVRFAALSSRIRHSMMDHLEKTGGVGNYVWLGPEARDRLIQEAPALKNIIEACPIPAEDGADEMLMFVIKFEQLIPRLQRYFDLDTMRKAILDFEPSQESARLLNLLGLQVARAKTSDAIMEVLQSITSVPWKGFKEKDHALQLILAAYNALSEKLSLAKPLHEATEPKHRQFYDRVLDAVRHVGYPSQILHDAQIDKIALRDVATLREAAGNARHARFHEAWLLMSTSDYHRYKPEQRKVLLEFLRDIDGKGALVGQRLVQVKAIDAIASLGRVAGDDELPLVRDVLNRTARWFAKHEVDPDICCLFLDAHAFLSGNAEGRLELGPEAMEALDRYFKKVAEGQGGGAKLVAIMSRWQELRTRAAVSAAA